jgi:hypothetical protein
MRIQLFRLSALKDIDMRLEAIDLTNSSFGMNKNGVRV